LQIRTNLESLVDAHELMEGLRKFTLHLSNGMWRADASNDIFALSIDQVLTIGNLLTSGWIASETNTSCRAVASVTENHLLNSNSSALKATDIVDLAIVNCTRVVPRCENSSDCQVQLLARISDKWTLGLGLEELLEGSNDLFQLIQLEIAVKLPPMLLLDGGEDVFELGMLNAHNDIAEHANEPTVGVISKTRVLGLSRKRLNSLIVQTKVQNSVHHA